MGIIKNKRYFGYTLLSIVATITIITYIYIHFVKVKHWFEINFNMLSYAPEALILSWILLVGYWIVTLVKRPYWYYWLYAVIWTAGQVFFTYGMILTYWM